MIKRKNLIGKKFGKLTVVEYAGKLDTQRKDGGNTAWKCICDCGKEITVRTFQLTTPQKQSSRHSGAQSCGCTRGLPRLNGDESSFRNLYSEYRTGAKRRGFLFELTKEQFRNITSLDCHYCGAKPSKMARTSNRLGISYIYNGIDRMNNQVGYIETNCAPCCFICNRMKFQFSAEDFVEHAHKIVNHFRRNQ